MMDALTRRGEILEMLRQVYNCIPKDPEIKDPEIKDLMEQNKITHLVDMRPSSLEFVIRETVKELGGIL